MKDLRAGYRKVLEGWGSLKDLAIEHQEPNTDHRYYIIEYADFHKAMKIIFDGVTECQSADGLLQS